jgi:predicted nucleic acid-binding protein
MPKSSTASTDVVIDAGVGAARVLPLPYSPFAWAAWRQWERDNAGCYAPSLWQYEAASAIRKTWAAAVISAEEADAALTMLLDLQVQLIPADTDLIRRALWWANRLQHRVISDSIYLALSERGGMDFWTADQRLVNGARQAGAAWVHWIGEAAAPQAES